MARKATTIPLNAFFVSTFGVAQATATGRESEIVARRDFANCINFKWAEWEGEAILSNSWAVKCSFLIVWIRAKIFFRWLFKPLIVSWDCLVDHLLIFAGVLASIGCTCNTVTDTIIFFDIVAYSRLGWWTTGLSNKWSLSGKGGR